MSGWHRGWFWDVDHDAPGGSQTIVYSGDDGHPIASFPFSQEGYDAADKLIADLRAGRTSEKALRVSRTAAGG